MLLREFYHFWVGYEYRDYWVYMYNYKGIELEECIY